METKEELFRRLDKYCSTLSRVEDAKAEYELERNRCRNAVPEGVYKNKFFHYFWPFVVFFFGAWVLALIGAGIFREMDNMMLFMVVLGIVQILVPIIGVGISWKLRDKQHRKVDEQIEEYRKKALESDSLKKLDKKIRDTEAEANELSKILPAKYRTLRGAQLIRKRLYKDDINTIEEAVESLN